MAIETPKYKVLDKNGRIELRRYSSYITASIEINADSYNTASSKAFGTLADYIFGNNSKSTKIAMTAPVMSQKPDTSEKIAMTAPVSASKLDEQTYLISFTMPSSYSIENLPKPNSSKVIIKNVPSSEVVVIRFSGYTTEEKIENMVKQLRIWANQKQIKLDSEPTLLRYDPPWKPGFIRRNEISFKLS